MVSALRPAHACAAETVTIVVRDMGNGVLRLESCHLLPWRLLGDESGLTLVFPLPLAVQDCLELAWGSLGSDPARCFSEGRCRPVCEDVREYYIW